MLRLSVFVLAAVAAACMAAAGALEDAPDDMHAKAFRVAVRLREDADPDRIARLHGFTNHGQVGSLKGHYVFEHAPAFPNIHREHIKALESNPDVEWLQIQEHRPRIRRPRHDSEI